MDLVAREASLPLHMMGKHKILIPCPECGETFQSSEIYVKHRMNHLSETHQKIPERETGNKPQTIEERFPRLARLASLTPSEEKPAPVLPPPVPSTSRVLLSSTQNTDLHPPTTMSTNQPSITSPQPLPPPPWPPSTQPTLLQPQPTQPPPPPFQPPPTQPPPPPFQPPPTQPPPPPSQHPLSQPPPLPTQFPPPGPPPASAGASGMRFRPPGMFWPHINSPWSTGYWGGY